MRNACSLPVLLPFLTGALALLHGNPGMGQIRDGAHTNPQHGVERVVTTPSSRGTCVQCHDLHAIESGGITGHEPALFGANDNTLCFDATGVGGCHRDAAANYPLPDHEFMPEFSAFPGYPEANLGGEVMHGVEMRGRWGGAVTYENPGQASGRDYSPHYADSDMPRRDSRGGGMCVNCHSPHGTPNPFDLLVSEYTNAGGHTEFGAPVNQRLCFDCHGPNGPMGMNASGRLIEDYYNESLNPGTAGHQIRRNPAIALSWPASMQVGDKMPCYACHNPHGSRGSSGTAPNAFLLDDGRPGWSGLTNPRGDPLQARAVCFGCHIPADGVPGSRVVLGIVMNTIPDVTQHRTTSTSSCIEVHGALYGTSTTSNIHNLVGAKDLNADGFWK